MSKTLHTINHNIIVYFITDISDMKVVSRNSSLAKLGMDSMMAVEASKLSNENLMFF